MFTALLASSVLAALSILLHYECLRALDATADRLASHRRRVLVTMFGLLLAHIIEIWLYAGAYAALAFWWDAGALVSVEPNVADTWDAVYYSAMVYTTVGFGDVVPQGPLRMVTATEALIGLSLITWSASFAFIQMQKVWR